MGSFFLNKIAFIPKAAKCIDEENFITVTSFTQCRYETADIIALFHAYGVEKRISIRMAIYPLTSAHSPQFSGISVTMQFLPCSLP